jgi:SsrA-binding protein
LKNKNIYGKLFAMKLITENRDARHNYFLESPIEAGIVLVGCEVKSLRQNHANLKDSYVIIRGREVYLLNCFISTFDKTGAFIPDTKRTRKLLLNKSEILKLERKTKEQGYTIVPTKMYFKDDKVKVEIALAKGKKLYDKKDDKMKADLKRYAERQMFGKR